MSFNFVIYFFNKQGCFQLINILYIFKTESLLLTHISSKIIQPKQQTFQKTTFPNIKNYTHATFTQCHAVFTTKEHTDTHTHSTEIFVLIHFFLENPAFHACTDRQRLCGIKELFTRPASHSAPLFVYTQLNPHICETKQNKISKLPCPERGALGLRRIEQKPSCRKTVIKALYK